MKFINKLLVTAAIICISISACQKDFTPEDDINPPGTVTDSNYLYKMYEIGIVGAVADTVNTWTYTYDAIKRVVNLRDSSSVIGAVYVAGWQYFYFGNDTLPYKSTYNVQGSGFNPTDSLISYFYYNSSGQRIKDSIIDKNNGENNYAKNYYQYPTGKIYGLCKDSTYNGTGYVINLTYDTAMLANGNIIHNRKYSNSDSIISTFTYDNKPSPFSKLSNYKTFDIFPFGETFFYEMPQLNNRLKANEHISGTGFSFDEDFTGKYLNKLNGYPYQIYYPDPSNPSFIYKVSFVYKSL